MTASEGGKLASVAVSYFAFFFLGLLFFSLVAFPYFAAKIGSFDFFERFYFLVDFLP